MEKLFEKYKSFGLALESPTFMDDIMNKVAAEISATKDLLVKEVVAQKIGDIDLDVEVKRRFPRIGFFLNHDGSEEYYWNDGTPSGIWLCTFYPEEPKMSYGDDHRFTLGLNFKS